MKTMSISIKTLSVALLIPLVLSACGGGGSDSPVGNGGPPMVVDANGVSTFDSTALNTSLLALPIETLTLAEQDSLLFMREEEKLAQDVYTQLNAIWSSQTRVFGNIAESEATHTEAVRQLLLRYNLPDPNATRSAGVYQNATLQGLYTQLVVSGNTSLVDALKVGGAIEEIDILDLQKGMLGIDNQDIILVYDSLLKGSRNHLRSFTSTLANRGVTYVPQYMAVADYQAIVSTPIERQ
jgi:hypothetical protein